MGIFKRLFCRSEETPQERLNHGIRTAVLGIQLERRKLWQSHEAFDRKVRGYLEEIEEALKERREQERDEPERSVLQEMSDDGDNLCG